MGFSSALQGRTAHDALLARQDAELRLLDTMRRALLQKCKFDREYALQLGGIASHGLKVDRSDDLHGSQVLRAWRGYMDECDQTAKQLRANAELLEAVCKDKLQQLHGEKQRARKAYQEEHQRITAQFNNLNDEVIRKKADYQKSLDYYKTLRARFEEHYIKSGRGGRKLDDVRDKYQKACRKLHLAHNEYVLLLSEAAEMEKDFRTILLPGLLEHQQQQQEDFIAVWRGIGLEAVSVGDWTAAKFQEIQRRVDAGWQSVNPAEEYREFTERNKTIPSAPITFQFDQSLIEDTLGNKLQPNALLVDNLTVDWLRGRLADLETAIKECDDKQTRLLSSTDSGASASSQSSSTAASASASSTSSNPASISSITSSSSQLQQNGSAATALNGNHCNGNATGKLSDAGLQSAGGRPSKDLNALRCLERQLHKSAEMIKTALNEVGCEELPSGCDLSVEQTFIEHDIEPDSPPSADQPFATTAATYLLKKGARTLSRMKAPFKRKSTPNVHISSSASCTTERSFTPRSTPAGARRHSEPRLAGSAADSSARPGSLMTLATNRPLYEEEWFHGVLPREEVVRLLKFDGDFLVRETIRNDESQIVLSVCWKGHKHFIVQTTAEGHFRFEGPFFGSIQELIMHQHLSEAPVTGRSGAVLKTPVLRERWELSNDDVILHDKIGRGNFGDVYKARLKSSKRQVAVKTCRMTLPDEQKRKFLQEGRILKQYDHPNIVKLIGICVQKQPIMIVMELVAGGSLLSFLRKNAGALGGKQMTGMCRDAAAGMRYLESKNCIHRDLAARNCLIGSENTVKISDFGMSREEEEYIVSDGMKQIPIKWTAPEALNFGKYTSLCDVWSYGILMWEIFSKGDTPYTGMSNSQARERIDSGYRMPSPESAPPEMYRLMVKCWAYEPETRPHFDEIHTVVDVLLSRMD